MSKTLYEIVGRDTNLVLYPEPTTDRNQARAFKQVVKQSFPDTDPVIRATKIDVSKVKIIR